jgi:hypothetical protein
MITPDEQLPINDANEDEMDDQRSQQDVHSNGLDDDLQAPADDDASLDMLQQASDASEPSFTLDVERDKKPGQ